MSSFQWRDGYKLDIFGQLLYFLNWCKGPFTNYVYKRKGVGGQKNWLFVNSYTIQNGRWSKKVKFCNRSAERVGTTQGWIFSIFATSDLKCSTSGSKCSKSGLKCSFLLRANRAKPHIWNFHRLRRYSMDFVTSHFLKMKLWRVERFYNIFVLTFGRDCYCIQQSRPKVRTNIL